MLENEGRRVGEEEDKEETEESRKSKDKKINGEGKKLCSF